jgi:DNA ligase-associated metallophosphoesterase
VSLAAPCAPTPADAHGALAIEMAGESLTLLPEKAAYLSARQTLLVADAHLGKAVSFRHLGVPVPSGTTEQGLATLDVLVARLGARRIVFLGDLLHSVHARSAATLAAVQAWRHAHAQLQLTLVRGNHDERAGDPPADWDVEVVDEPLRIGPWALCHHPQRLEGAQVLAGHLHPCVTLTGRGRDRLRLPCFWQREGITVLPAFGPFTGMHAVRRVPSERVYAIAGHQVVDATLA